MYGNGDMGNQGVHEMDIARWGLGVTLPSRITAAGAKVMFEDMQNTPNVFMVLFEFPDPAGRKERTKILQFEVRHWDHNPEGALTGLDEGKNTYMTSSENTVGNLFFGSKGYMSKNVAGLGNHFQDFVDAIRAGDQSLARGDIREGFYSCALIHLGNISYRLGRSLDFDPEAMRFVNDKEADQMLTSSAKTVDMNAAITADVINSTKLSVEEEDQVYKAIYDSFGNDNGKVTAKRSHVNESTGELIRIHGAKEVTVMLTSY